MADIINIKDIPKPELSKRTKRVTLTALALSMEYFTKVKPDPAFVAEARSSLLRHNRANLVCNVSLGVHKKETEDMPAVAAVEKLLYG